MPRKITGLDPNIINIIKGAVTPETAAWRVAKYFEKPKDINASINRRYKAAREALALYRKYRPRTLSVMLTVYVDIASRLHLFDGVLP